MNEAFNEAFNEVDKKVHPVEDQWHYKYLVPHGFVPETKEGVGFVRRYVYRHPDGRFIACSTGASADYWEGSDGKWGYWATLEAWAKGN